MTLSPHTALAALLALCLAVAASPDRLCLDACACRLTLKQHTARLRAHCDNVTEFPSVLNAAFSVVLLRLGDREALKPLKDFRCDNCQLDGIDRTAFEGLDYLHPPLLADDVLVQVPNNTIDGEGGVDLTFVRSDIVDCDAFIREFGDLRPTVAVDECDPDERSATRMMADAEAAAPGEQATSSTEKNDDTTLSPRGVILRNYPGDAVEDADDADADTTPTEEEDDIISPRPDGRRRNEDGDIIMEDTDETPGDDVQRLEGVQPLVPVTPDEDPATVFAPWTIAVIAGVGAIIVAVVAYYVWQKWTEIRSCCCGSEYSRP